MVAAVVVGGSGERERGVDGWYSYSTTARSLCVCTEFKVARCADQMRVHSTRLAPRSSTDGRRNLLFPGLTSALRLCCSTQGAVSGDKNRLVLICYSNRPETPTSMRLQLPNARPSSAPPNTPNVPDTVSPFCLEYSDARSELV